MNTIFWIGIILVVIVAVGLVAAIICKAIIDTPSTVTKNENCLEWIEIDKINQETIKANQETIKTYEETVKTQNETIETYKKIVNDLSVQLESANYFLNKVDKPLSR